MRDEAYCDALLLYLHDAFEALVLEVLVSHRQHLVHQQDLRVGVHRYGEPQSHVHARRVVLHRHVNETLQFRKGDDLIQFTLDLSPAQPQNGAV